MASRTEEHIISLKSYLETTSNPEKIKKALNKLDRLDITLDLLQSTGIGKAVNSFRKHDDGIGPQAKALVAKWKQAVASKQPEEEPVQSNSKASVQTVTESETLYTGTQGPRMDDFPASKHRNKEKKDEHDRVNDREKSRQKSDKHDKHNSTSRSDSHRHKDKKSRDDGANEKSQKSSTGSKSSSHRSDREESKHDKEKNKNDKEKGKYDKEKSKTDKEKSKNSGDKKSSSRQSGHGENSHKDKDGAQSKHDSKHSKESKHKHKETKSGNSVNFNDLSEDNDSEVGIEAENSGISFADLMSYDTAPSKSKKKQVSSSRSHKVSGSHGDKHKHKHKSGSESKKRKSDLDLDVPAKQIKLSQEDILASLPQTQPHYKPLPEVKLPQDGSPSKYTKGLENFDSAVIGTKTHTKTQVYSGRKGVQYLTAVPKLFDACMKVLMDNLEGLGYVGGVPADLLHPVLEKCTVQQLYYLEDQNPHFVGDTERHWEKHCLKEFRKCEPEEMQSWRELYLEKHDEREQKFEKLKANISESIMNKGPARKTQLAYVDSVAKAPRSVRRKQISHGTAGPTGKIDPLAKLSSRGSEKSPRAPAAMEPVERPKKDALKPKAPMMAKSLKFMKKLQRR